jgi:apolipoprotein N-acyltransferase
MREGVRPIVLALLTGLLYTVSLSHLNAGALAWLALLPLHLALHQVSKRRAFWIGWLAGISAFVGSMFWVINAMHLYGHVPLPISIALMLLLSSYLGLFVAFYAVGFNRVQSAFPSLASLSAPFLWVALEWLRTHLFSGLPWSLLGYSQYQSLAVIQIADVTAVYGVSFVIVLVNAALADVCLWYLTTRRGPQPVSFPWRIPVLALCIVVMSLWYGQVQLSRFAKTGEQGPQTRSINIGLVQANIDQAVKWDEQYRLETQERYARLTAQAATNTELVLWPEAATPYFFEIEPEFRREISGMVRTRGVPLLLGSPAIGYYPDRRPYLTNSAYLLSAEGSIQGRYSKRHLVPFGEYIPLHSSVLFFLDKLVQGIGDFRAGTEATLFTVPPRASQEPSQTPSAGSGKGPTFGVVICYEVIFPNEVREFSARGADFMVTITNDAWFGRSSAPYQHFEMVVFRAVENKVAFARAANTGISGFIDPTGRIIEATPIFQEAAITGRIPVGHVPTFYSEHGDIFAYACVIIAAAFTVASRRRRQ